MRKLVLVAVVALLWAAPASAKELLGVQLCGASGCATLHDTGLREGPGGPIGGEGIAPAKFGPWFRGSVLLGDHGKIFGKVGFYYVPDGGLLVEPGQGGQPTTWIHPQGRLAALLERLSKTMRAHPAPTITNVAVGGRSAADPQSYARLYATGEKATTYPTETGTQVVIETAQPTPWSDGNYVVVYPESGLIVRDGQLVSVPGTVARRAARGLSLGHGGGGLPWSLFGGVAAAAVALLVCVRLLRRPRAVPRPVVQA
jgi:hypothetical protein